MDPKGALRRFAPGGLRPVVHLRYCELATGRYLRPEANS